jgi:hypothetical protein
MTTDWLQWYNNTITNAPARAAGLQLVINGRIAKGVLFLIQCTSTHCPVCIFPASDQTR